MGILFTFMIKGLIATLFAISLILIASILFVGKQIQDSTSFKVESYADNVNNVANCAIGAERLEDCTKNKDWDGSSDSYYAYSLDG